MSGNGFPPEFAEILSRELVVKDGIAEMLDEASLYPEAADEVSSRDKEALDYDVKLSVREYKEIPSTIKPLYPWADKLVIDYGCGTGRVSSKLAGARVLGVDISRKSLKVFQYKDVPLKSLGLVHADSTTFKVRPKSFDRALCAQVYEHIPERARRIAFLKNVHEALKDDGVFVATVYHHDLRRSMAKEPQEGRHPSGIFYHYFTSSELEEEFRFVFPDVSIQTIDITLPLEARLKLSPKTGGLISCLAEPVPLLNRFGHLLRVVAKVRH